jgi:TnpA family transposase
MQTPEILLTEDRRKELMQIPPDMSDWEIAKHYTLSVSDIEVIRQNRKDYNRIGFALQLCCLRYPGWTLTNIREIPDTLIYYVANQINAKTKEIQRYG